MKQLNKWEMSGKSMTEKEEIFLNTLRVQIKNKEITRTEAHRIWDEKVLKIKRPDWWYKE